MSNAVPTYMFCNRTADRPAVAAPSERRTCGRCGAEVWISKGSLRVVERTAAEIVCIPCALRLGMVEPGERVAPQPEQLPEILDAIVNDLPGDRP